ncbi:MAG: MATE family efflux transporter, partial [Bacteroidetes bacterium]|nr:MATE family efflux transporter [Bacteroidota bacterium]MBU1718190.1 MATE family efflux transporter [Bacteroidota bacterium]
MKSVISSTFVAAMRSNKDIWNITYPIILGLVAQNVINVTDTAFLGRVGEAELGASAIGGLFYIALFMLGFGFGIGAQILMARRNGERNFRDIGRIFDQSLYFLFALAVVLWAFIWFLSPGILRDAIASPDVYKKSVEYIDYRIFGIFFAFMNVLFRSFYISITRTLIITMGAAIMAVVNIVLDYVMIFGHAGFPEMGIAG